MPGWIATNSSSSRVATNDSTPHNSDFAYNSDLASYAPNFSIHTSANSNYSICALSAIWSGSEPTPCLVCISSAGFASSIEMRQRTIGQLCQEFRQQLRHQWSSERFYGFACAVELDFTSTRSWRFGAHLPVRNRIFWCIYKFNWFFLRTGDVFANCINNQFEECFTTTNLKSLGRTIADGRTLRQTISTLFHECMAFQKGKSGRMLIDLNSGWPVYLRNPEIFSTKEKRNCFYFKPSGETEHNSNLFHGYFFKGPKFGSALSSACCRKFLKFQINCNSLAKAERAEFTLRNLSRAPENISFALTAWFSRESVPLAKRSIPKVHFVDLFLNCPVVPMPDLSNH